MKKFNFSFIAFSFALMVLSSCSSLDKNAPLVPKDAAIVLHLNTNSLSSKLSWDDIKKTNWFIQMSSEQKDSLTKKLLENPDNSGIDTGDGLFVFMRKTQDGAGYGGFTGKIKNAAAFEAFNKKISEGKEVINKNNLKSIVFADKATVTWNDNQFLYLAQSDFTPPAFDMDSTGQRVYREHAPLNLQDVAARIFNYKKDSLITDNDRFNSLLKDAGDVHLWSNAEGMSMDNANLGFLSLLRTDVYFKESVTAATLSFEKGKIVMHAKMYSNKEMEEVMRKYSGDNINLNYIERIPSDNVVGLLAANYKPEGLKQFLKLGGLDGLVNSFLGKYDLTLDQVVAASKGDMLITVTDVGVKRKMVSLGQGMDSLPINSPSAEVLLAMSVKDKAPFEKLVGVAQQMGKNRQLPAGVTYKFGSDLFVVGTNPGMVDQYLKGGNKEFPFTSKIKGHPIAFYLDLNKLISTFNEQIKDTAANSVFKASVEMWKDVVATGGEFKDGAVQQEIEVNMIDQNTNSLQQLNSYIDKVSSNRKKPF